MSEEHQTPDRVVSIGERVRALREARNLSMSQLADLANVSKSSLHELETNPKAKPSAENLYSISLVLETTVGYLLGRQRSPRVVAEAEAPIEIPASLEEFARKERIPDEDKRRLACIKYRGRQPRTADDWRFVYEALRRSTER